MGDISAEPSMEEILSSIKRIIAEEGEPPSRTRRASRSAPTPPPVTATPDEPEVLELNTPVAPPQEAPLLQASPSAPTSQPTTPSAEMAATADDSPAQLTPESILSREAAAASRGKLDMLSRLVTKPEPGSDGTLDGLVRDNLRPMLREGLDTNLPPMVEQMVAREIGKITGQV